MPLSSRSWLCAALLPCAALLLAPRVAAQARRTLASDDPQAQLMGYYAAVMHMTPVGLAERGLSVGGELTFIPDLSEQERRVGFGGTKLEKTNFCPVLPRLRGSLGTATQALELGLVPPVEVCGVRALLLTAAYTRRVPLRPGWDLALRGAVLVGSLEAAITCSDEAIRDQNEPTCFGGRESEDRVKPLTLGAEAMLVRAGHRRPGLELYALLGLRHERTRFDVNYVRDTVPPALDDHERLQANLTRAHLAAGASYRVSGPLRLGAEAYYAPGALFTVRGRASVSLRGRQ